MKFERAIYGAAVIGFVCGCGVEASDGSGSGAAAASEGGQAQGGVDSIDGGAAGVSSGGAGGGIAEPPPSCGGQFPSPPTGNTVAICFSPGAENVDGGVVYLGLTESSAPSCFEDPMNRALGFETPIRDGGVTPHRWSFQTFTGEAIVVEVFIPWLEGTFLAPGETLKLDASYAATLGGPRGYLSLSRGSEPILGFAQNTAPFFTVTPGDVECVCNDCCLDEVTSVEVSLFNHTATLASWQTAEVDGFLIAHGTYRRPARADCLDASHEVFVAGFRL